MRKELARYRGKETNATGDGFFVTFDSPARAVMKPIPITRRRGTGAHCTHRLFFRNIVDRIGKTTSLISSPEYFFSLHPVFCAYPPCWRTFTTFSIVFQLRVVAATPNFFSILPRIADRLHLPTIQTENESVLDRNDLQQPVLIRRQDREEDKTAREVVWSDRSGGRLHCGIFKVAAYSLTLLKLRRYTSFEPVFAQNILRPEVACRSLSH